MPTLFLVGCGFVGGTILDRLLKEKRYDILVNYRKDGQESVLNALGVRPVKASLDDLDVLEKTASECDVVINTASSDHPESIQAILRGVERRLKQAQKSIYIHTSGTGVLADQSAGEATSELIYVDTEPAPVDKIDEGVIHRRIDRNMQLKAAKWHESDLVNIRIMLPPLIFGKGSGPFKTNSVQIPSLIRASIKEGFSVMHGRGEAIWSHIDVQDLADGYIVLLNALEKNGSPEPRSPDDVYVYCESAEHKWRDVSSRIGQILKTKGLVESAEPKSLSYDKLKTYGLVYDKEMWNGSVDYLSVGSNSRSRAVKLRELGWKPKSEEADALFNSLEYDVDVILNEG